MIDPEVQPLRITVEVIYDAVLYDGDPGDAYEIAQLEKDAIEDSVIHYMEKVVGPAKSIKIKVTPV